MVVEVDLCYELVYCHGGCLLDIGEESSVVLIGVKVVVKLVVDKFFHCNLEVIHSSLWNVG